jgi:hypothetical protein
MEIENNSRYRKCKASTRMECLTFSVSQASLDIHSTWISLISNEVTDSQRSVYDRIFIGLSKVLVPNVQFIIDYASGRCIFDSHILHLIISNGLHELGLLARFVSKHFLLFSMLVEDLCMLYCNFYSTFSCYLSSTTPGLRYLYKCPLWKL